MIVVDSIRENIHQKYHYESVNKDFIVSVDPILDIYDDPKARMLQRLAPITKKVTRTNIDKYFTTPRVDIKPSRDREWLAKNGGGIVVIVCLRWLQLHGIILQFLHLRYLLNVYLVLVVILSRFDERRCMRIQCGY